MSEHQRETAFLRHLLTFDDSAERRQLEEGIAQVQRDGRCVKRAATLMALLTALGAAGLGYGAVFQENFPYGKSRLVLELLGGLGLTALICLICFGALLMVYRQRMNGLREHSRRLVLRVLESRLVSSPVAASTAGDPPRLATPAPQRAAPTPGGTPLWGEIPGTSEPSA
jgi:hypothetical protein